MKNWINDILPNEDIVISSRIRLARNIDKISFPYKLNENEGRSIVKKVQEAFKESKSLDESFTTINLWENTNADSKIYFEKHLISKKLIANNKIASFIYNSDETISLMINEEDHLRLQAVTSGFNLNEAFEQINKIDDIIEEHIEYAFDEELGYLTACPTNVGTGLRASVMLHLPALTSKKEINNLTNALNRVGMTIRGLYGEGTQALSNIYQISNQITLGISEIDIIKNLEGVTNQVIKQEKQARDILMKNYEDEVRDKIFRSLGILKSSIIINKNESLELLSNVRLGIELGIIEEIDKSKINELLVKISDTSIEMQEARKLTEKEKNIKRSEIIKFVLR